MRKLRIVLLRAVLGAGVGSILLSGCAEAMGKASGEPLMGSRGGMASWLVPMLLEWRFILAEWRRSPFIAVQNWAKG